jgi:AcrR family transcriptional regulator
MSKDTTSVKRLRDQHAEATRAALVQAAVQRFSRDGHAGTSLDDIAADVGTTKGAVYHHFKDKRAVFAAAYEHLSQALIGALALDPRTQQDGAYGAIRAFLDLATQDGFRRVLFVEGPVVLGSQACRDIDMRYSRGLLQAMVEMHAPPELKAQVPAEILTSLLLCLLVESAQLISSAQEPAQTTHHVEVVLRTAIGALIKPSASA